MELADFVAWTRKKPIQVRFIEYMPFDGNTWSDKKFMSYSGMTGISSFNFLEMIENIRANGFPLDRVPDGPNETSKTYKVDGFRGSVGFITSMSDHFCSTCNRIRMMADGALKVIPRCYVS
jgi:cyclic pyranopterin phosphate synthase